METQRLLFHTHEPQDEPDFISMHTDPEVRRYVGGRAWPLEKARARFREEYLGRPKETYGLWATILKEEKKYIGCCGLRAGDKKGEAHLGYYLAQPYWGRGFASEASLAFIGVAFTRLRLVRLLADVEKGNDASEHILQKFGFKYISREEIPASGRVINALTSRRPETVTLWAMDGIAVTLRKSGRSGKMAQCLQATHILTV
jgi:ribosomal-protein-alanine N-acetyltransferase